MELKKTLEANIEKKKPMLFSMGMAVALAITLIAFEFSVFEGGPSQLGQLDIDLEEEEMIPITQQQPPPPPPPPQPAQIIEIVEDDEEIEEELEIESTEAFDDTEVEIVEVEEEVDEEPQIFTIVEQMPAFPGGEKKMFQYLGDNIEYPAMARDAGIKGTVYTTFMVDESGKIKNVKILRGIGGGCDEEALRVIKSMPSWTPGKQRGKAVRVQFTLPVRFTLR